MKVSSGEVQAPENLTWRQHESKKPFPIDPTLREPTLANMEAGTDTGLILESML